MCKHDSLITANIIRKQRKRLNITQEKLSEQTGIELSKIKRYELGDNGDMPFSELNLLSGYFGITMDFLMTGEQHINPNSDLEKLLSKPSRHCSCGNNYLVVDADEAGFSFVFCPQCKKQGLRVKGIEDAIKIWNKGK